MIQTEHNIFKNSNWSEENQLACNNFVACKYISNKVHNKTTTVFGSKWKWS